ncbi:MAG: dihydroorotate dehydrogenase (quinone) [Chloroflexi bacterium]|nr:dihydroorotate dehydrogenase (quinone) [Chloroflexota bacterium]
MSEKLTFRATIGNKGGGGAFVRPLLFRLDPETAHALTLYLLRFTSAVPPVNWILAKVFYAPTKPVHAFGLTFKNPVGLAAGYDKDGVAVRGLAALGLGHIEIGTVTPRPQSGNPKPRVFRLPEDEAVINRMGFPSKGADFVAMSLRGAQRRSNLLLNGTTHVERGLPKCHEVVRRQRTAARNDMKVIVGVNLGKNKDTPLEEVAEDYISLMRTFAPLADYLAINVSSPNTVGLRRLQGRAMLENLLGQVNAQRGTCNPQRPILVKLAPDLTDDELDDALDVILRTGMDGVIATNTTLGRAGLRSARREESGGLSGEPLKGRSEAVLRSIVKKLGGRIPIVSVGGIMSPQDACKRLDLGATLVQVYTGLIYAGPGLIRKIIRAV